VKPLLGIYTRQSVCRLKSICPKPDIWLMNRRLRTNAFNSARGQVGHQLSTAEISLRPTNARLYSRRIVGGHSGGNDVTG
jgi:hypothetical protein